MKNQNFSSQIWMYVSLFVSVCLFVGFLYLSFLLVNQEKKITFVASGHPEWPPIMWQEGDNIVGAGPDLVNKICSDLKINCEVKFEGQWQEVQDKAKTGAVDMLVAAYKTNDRQTYMDYSDSYTIDPITLFTKSGTTWPYNQWSDLIGKKGVVTVGDSYGQEFDNYIKDNLTVESVDTVGQAFDKILDGSADYFVYCLYGGRKAINDLGLKGQVESVPNYIDAEKFYITISKKSPFAKYMPQINELIAKYTQDGTIQKLIQQNENLSGTGAQ